MKDFYFGIFKESFMLNKHNIYSINYFCYRKIYRKFFNGIKFDITIIELPLFDFNICKLFLREKLFTLMKNYP